MKQCRECSMLFRADVHKCPKCGSYEIDRGDEPKAEDYSLTEKAAPSQRASTVRTKPRLRGYIVPQTPTPLQGEQAVTADMIREHREEVARGAREAEDDSLEMQRRAASAFEAALERSLSTDATVEVPNPLSAGLEFSSDVFLEDRLDPSVERPMPELRRDPSVERKMPELPGEESAEFARQPTRPREKALPRAPKPPPAPSGSASGLSSETGRETGDEFGLDESLIEEALSGIDLSLRDAEIGREDPSLILELGDALSEEEIDLARSLVAGEREVRHTPTPRDLQHSMPKVELSAELVADSQRLEESSPHREPEAPTAPRMPPPVPQRQSVAATRRSTETAREETPGPRIGSRLIAVAAILTFGGAAVLALTASLTSIGGWVSALAAVVMMVGVVRKDLGWGDEILHVIAAGAAVASTQPWALDLAQIGQTSFWRTPAAMTCVGAVIVGLVLVVVSVERSTVSTGTKTD